ncbi:MAG TPA: DUF2461 domain-containing protein [Cyclobacteriaceae bacterium]|nr:DUF2461 domain-containing protein [Cyclobacteriaceae bacterium]
MVTIEKSTLDFLKRLSVNNNRDWFNKRKEEYLDAQANVESFVDDLILLMNRHDHIETTSGKKSLYRIYNDVRFSIDKTPYSPRFAGYLRRAKPMLRGCYYFWITPGNSRIGVGFAYPKPEDLLRIRQDININYPTWNRLLKRKSLVNTFGTIQGDKVNTAPRGFDKNHPAIELLRLKQYWFEHTFSDREVLSPDFARKMNEGFKFIRPFFDHMSEVLGTDLNGETRLI